MTAMRSTATEQELLEAACRGEDEAFRLLVEPHRAALHAHCYRMLGSLHDADDAPQEALLRAWRNICRFAGRGPLTRWLYQIATNACLDALARRRKRVLPIDYAAPVEPRPGEPAKRLPEGLWVEPYPDEVLALPEGYAAPDARYEQREAIELAFVAALQHLPPRQRAVLVLREVLGFSAKEVSDTLGTTVASVNSALQRARKALDERLPERSQQATMRSIGDRRVREIVQRFIDAFERGDVDAIVSLLAEDATFEMPPHPTWYQGRAAVSESWLIPSGPTGRLRYVPTRANGQVAVAAYALDEQRRRFVPLALDVVSLRGAQIADITAFRTPSIFPRFALPEELAA